MDIKGEIKWIFFHCDWDNKEKSSYRLSAIDYDDAKSKIKDCLNHDFDWTMDTLLNISELPKMKPNKVVDVKPSEHELELIRIDDAITELMKERERLNILNK